MGKDTIKVLLVGQPYWTNHLCTLMNRYASDMVTGDYVPIPGAKPWGLVRRLCQADLILRVGFRPGMRKLKTRVFDMFWHAFHSVNAKAVWGYYWIGSDLYATIRDYRSHTLTWFFSKIHNDHHLAGAQWFREELKEIGISGSVCLFPDELPVTGSDDLCWPRDFGVLSYVPDPSYVFYGGESLLRAARVLPHMRFDIVGGTGKWVENPLPNVRFHGWQTNLLPFFMDSTVMVRLVPHDALGGMVRKALTLARHVIYSYSIPFTRHVDWQDEEALIQTLQELYEKHVKGQLAPNLEGREYALREWNGAVLTRNLTNTLMKLVQTAS
ncbi:MAG: hypothetical protein A4E63_02104 [Syntrophorhabdus sp. PtaU1.Bin050]|nr:MAG: hypothetical protein A4E63_02104 [Syntrophorhabdus sp. PtaU1.Bin050]